MLISICEVLNDYLALQSLLQSIDGHHLSRIGDPGQELQKKECYSGARKLSQPTSGIAEHGDRDENEGVEDECSITIGTQDKQEASKCTHGGHGAHSFVHLTMTFYPLGES